MPNWEAVGAENPATVSWSVPFVGLGLAWLLVRPSTRFFGLVVAGLYTMFLTASALQIYPLGTGRPDMFAFPATICLFAAGVQPGHRSTAAAQALSLGGGDPGCHHRAGSSAPRRVLEVNDVPLIDYLAAHVQPDDDLIVSPSGIFLVAYYGPWPVTAVETEHFSYAMATIGRERTRYLYPRTREAEDVSRYLTESKPNRAWYLAYRTGVTEPDVIAAMEARGYRVHQAQETRRGRLYLALATR